MKKCLPALLIFCIIACFCACNSTDVSVSSAIPQNEGSSSQAAENDNTSEIVSNIVSRPGNIQIPETSKPTSSGAIIYKPSKNKIPSGCTYKTASGLTLTAGSMMPKEVADGDIFEDSDYIYCYNRVCDPLFGTEDWFKDKNSPQGWSVVVKDSSKTSYPAIRKSINGKDVTNLYNTFLGCTSLVYSPALPETVTNMYSTFLLCESLKTAPKIPEGVTNMTATFLGCDVLKNAPKIPDGVTDMGDTFKSCVSLETAPEIPETVTNLTSTFYQCRLLKKAPKIPKNVLYMDQTFYECEALEGEIIIDACPDFYEDCFRKTTKKIILSGSSDMLDILQRTSPTANIDIKD